jgi:hypothetical protein
MLRKRPLGLIAVGLMLAAVLATGLAAGTADAATTHSTIHSARAMNLTADPSTSCGIWTDGITFGIKCSAFSGWYYQSRAVCKNGKTVTGPIRIQDQFSYAYCSSVESQINYAHPLFGPEVPVSPISGGPTAAPVTSAADPSGSCGVWTDGTTFGIACTGFSGWSYYAAAVCKNGREVPGTRENGTSGKFSYAYCSSVNSTISTMEPYFSPFTI